MNIIVIRILLGRLETFAESRRAVLGRSLSVTVKFKAHSKCSALRFEPSHHPPRGNFLQPQPFFTAFHANAREFVAWTSSIGIFHPNHPTDLCKLTFLVTVASVRAHHTVHHKRCVSSHCYYHIFTTCLTNASGIAEGGWHIVDWLAGSVRGRGLPRRRRQSRGGRPNMQGSVSNLSAMCPFLFILFTSTNTSFHRI
jgi:hypothetical protein